MEGAGIFLIDVDDFKAINDSLGYETGDLLLTQISNRLLQFIGPQNHFQDYLEMNSQF